MITMAVVFSMLLINFELKFSGNQPMTIISMISSSRHNHQEWVRVIKYVAYSMLISQVTVWFNSKIYRYKHNWSNIYQAHVHCTHMPVLALSFQPKLMVKHSYFQNTSSQGRLFNIMYHIVQHQLETVLTKIWLYLDKKISFDPAVITTVIS